MPLALSDDDVRVACPLEQAIAAVEAACRELAEGEAALAPRLNLALPNGWIRLMACALPRLGVTGYKEFHLADAEGIRYTVHLFEYATGRPLAVLDARWLTELRTGAVGGTAARALAPEELGDVAVVGAGTQARAQLRALASVRRLGRVRVFSPRRESRARFAAELGAELGVELEPVDTVEQALAGADAVLAATNTGGRGAALSASALGEARFVCSIGSTMARQREIDPDTWAWAERIVVDSLHLLDESGDALAARAAGVLEGRELLELHDVVASGAVAGGGRTLFKSAGTAVQDVAVAWAAYRAAAGRGIGTPLPELVSVKPPPRAR